MRWHKRNRRRNVFISGLIVVSLLAGCAREIGRVQKAVQGGDPVAGRQSIERYGCGSCHTINGVAGADALVGPPLNGFAQRHYIAGNLPNTADNLIFWIQFPQRVEPGTAMPDMGVPELDARNIAAYLYTQ